MSRDHLPELLYDHGRRPSGGQDVPRGGRAGGASRPREARPADVRDALAQQLDLPRSQARERVSADGRLYQLRHADVRVLATVGAFRVTDVRDIKGGVGDRWQGDVEHLRRSRLVELTPYVIEGQRTALVTLTREGQALLEASRQREMDQRPQAYHAGFVKPRELGHDAQLFRVYADAAERLHRAGNRVERVVLDYELKRDYQRFLQDNNRVHGRHSGRPDRSDEEVRTWAAAHDLPMHEGQVKFPDVRIEYERPDGTPTHEDLELATPHYNRSQMAGKAGFRVTGGRGRGGRRPDDTSLAEKVLR